MQLRVPRGQVVSPRRRGYAGDRVLRQAFFPDFLTALRGNRTELEAVPAVPAQHADAPRQSLIVRKIIPPKLGRRTKRLIAVDNSAAMSAWNELIFARVGRDNPGATRGQTINQPPIRCDSKHSDAHRAPTRRRCRSQMFLFAFRARLGRWGGL